MVLVKRDRPHTCRNAAALSSRLLWAVYTAVVCDGRLLFGSACVPSGICSTLAAAVVCLESWYEEIRPNICRSSFFSFFLAWCFSSTHFASIESICFLAYYCCFLLRKQTVKRFLRLFSTRDMQAGPCLVGWLPQIGRSTASHGQGGLGSS